MFRFIFLLVLLTLVLSLTPAFAWLPEQNLTADNPGAGAPAIAVGPTGIIHCVYAHQPPGQKLRLYYKSLTGSGWSVPVDLPGPNSKEPQCAIAVDKNGHVHVVGIYCPYDPNVDKPYTVFYWEYDGVNWTGPTQLSSGTGAYPAANSTSVRIAVDMYNDVHVVWSQGDMVSDEADIMYRKRQSGYWLPIQNVTANPGDDESYGSVSPDLAVDRDGQTIHLVWHDDFLRNGHQAYYTQNTNLGDPSAWLPSSQWKQLNSGVYGKGPQIVLDRNDYPNIWWTDRFGGIDNQQAYCRWTGTSWTNPVSWQGQWFMGVEFDVHNTMHYLYVQENASDTLELYYKKYDYNSFTAPEPVSTGANTLKVDAAAFALDNDALPHALWIERKGAWPGLSYVFYSKGIITTPPGPVVNFSAKAVALSKSQIELKWTNPASVNFAGTTIRYKLDGYPSDQYDGNLLVNLPGTPGASTSFIHNNLPSGQLVYYGAFAYNGDYAYSTGVFDDERVNSNYKDIAQVGDGARVFALAAAPSGLVYTGTDGTSSIPGTFGVYNPATDTWTKLNRPYTGRVLSLLVHSNGLVYGCQGSGSGSGTADDGGVFWSYDPKTGAFDQIYYDPAKQVQGEMTEGPDGRIWFGDGYLNLLVYDPKLPKSSVNPRIYPKPAGVSGVLVGGIEIAKSGYVYVTWGSYSSGGVDVQFDFFKLNPTTGVWTRLTLPASVGGQWICNPLLTADDGFIYGVTQRGTGIIIRIDPETDNIVDMGSQFPAVWGSDGRRIVGAAWADNGRLYWGSSKDNSPTVDAHLFFFDRSQPAGTYNGSRDNGPLPSDTQDITSLLYSKGRVYLGVRMDTAKPRLFYFDVAGTAATPPMATLHGTSNGTVVTLNCKVVTGAFGDHFYIEELDRTAGIKVVSNASVAVGSKVSVTGKIEVVDGERQITASAVDVYSGGNRIPDPFGWNVRSIGGGPFGNTPGLYSCYGLNNVGLLGRVVGKVVGKGNGPYFFLDDGSNTVSDESCTGVKVISSLPVTEGQMLIVTGISSVALDGQDRPIRQIRTRSDSDVIVLP